MDALFERKKSPNPSAYDQFLVVDYSNLKYKVAMASGYQETSTQGGVPSGHIFGMTKMLLGLFTKFQAGNTILVFAHDCHPEAKIKLYPEYKANRTNSVRGELLTNRTYNKRNEMTDVEYLLSVIPHFDIYMNRHEADDVIASFIKKNRTKGKHAVVYSSDQDMWQLCSKHVICYAKEVVGNDDIKKVYRLPYKQAKKIAMYKAIYGDMGDNIPGINSVESDHPKLRWDVELKKIFSECDGTPDNFYSLIKKSKLKCRLRFRDAQKLVYRNYKLIKLRKKLKYEQSFSKGNLAELKQMLTFFECDSIVDKTGVFF